MPSTAIRDLSYDDERQQLAVTFVMGRSYIYYDVPPDVAAGLETAPSRGVFFNATIRDRYRFDEILPAR